MQAPLYGVFIVKRFESGDLSCFLDRFLCSTWNPVSSPRPAVLQSRRAQELSRLAVAPTLRRTVPLPGHLDSFEHDRTVGAVGMTIRGEPLSGRGSIAPRPCIRWVQDPNHDALIRIGGEAPRRLTHSFSRRPQCRHWRSIR